MEWVKDETPPPPPTINELIAEREPRYGAFRDRAALSQSIKNIMVLADGWSKLTAPQAEALEMIALKITRILNGDPSYVDNWVDIAGYAQLVADILHEDEKA